MDIPDNLLEWIINKIEEYIQNNDKLIIDYEEIYYKIICNFLLYYPIYEYEPYIEWIEFAFLQYFNWNNILPPNDFFIQLTDFNVHNEILTDNYIQITQNKLIKLIEKDQSTQKTNIWYEVRHNMITASNAYKAFESQCVQNQLIYEKCKSIKGINETTKLVNTNSTLHWGHKYEPLSVMIYETMYNTHIGTFGCLPHPEYSFLGASPDGINDDPLSSLFGRMLEIKNIVNRQITGIPKKEYWIQMQMQMEVCDLDTCDFLETQFIQFANQDIFWEEVMTDILPIGTAESHYANIQSPHHHFYREEYNKFILRPYYGMIMQFYEINNNDPIYIYRILLPTDTFDTLQQWQIKIMDERPTMQWVTNHYWKLAKYSITFIKRDRHWFNSSINTFKTIWHLIEKERIEGWEHRAPKRRKVIEKETFKQIDEKTPCMFKFIRQNYP